MLFCFKFDLWSRVKTTDETVTALLSPQAFTKYKMFMSLLEMPFEILNENAARLVIFQYQTDQSVFNLFLISCII
jgi:hypothetical protein